MRIALFTDSFYPELGGIQDSVLLTSRALGERGHQVMIFAPSAPARDFQLAGLPTQEIDLGDNVTICRLCSVRVPSSTGQSRLLVPTGRRWRQLRDFKPDIIHTHTFLGAGWEALRASRRLNVPIVGTNHWAIGEFGSYTPFSADFFSHTSVKWVTRYYNHCLRVSGPSQSVLDEMLSFGLSVPSQVVSNPIDTHLFKPVDGATKASYKQQFGFTDQTICYAGRLANEKNIDVLIRALAIVVEELPNAMLVLAGHGSARESLYKLAQSLGIAERVKFLGTLNKAELAKVYQGADTFAIASTSETQSMVLLQAMSCGLPAVGAHWRALPEYIDGQSGFTAPPGDAKAFAHQLLKLLSQPELRAQMGEYATHKTQQFSIDRVTCTWEQIYTDALTPRYINSYDRSTVMKLSLIIPAYNEERYLAQCLTYACAEMAKYAHLGLFEIIVIDNASTDRTAEVASTFAGVRVVYEPNKGLTCARQRGLEEAQGEILAFIDADTRMPSGWVPRVLDAYAADNNLTCISGPYRYYDLPIVQRWLVKAYWSMLARPTYWFTRYMAVGGNFAASKAALLAIGGFDTSIAFYGEDTDIARRLHKKGRVLFDMKLVMETSARRLREEGFLATAAHYVANFVSEVIRKKPSTTEYRDIR
ncbi:glycosyltransferase [Celerinatantimonas yamalensis]|uniref:Glycosyltransferase n=1 Tax=Celerinatantimonas yamalensis TaxID=559956 RepID=A0ABW9G996_9GAMM